MRKQTKLLLLWFGFQLLMVNCLPAQLEAEGADSSLTVLLRQPLDRNFYIGNEFPIEVSIKNLGKRKVRIWNEIPFAPHGFEFGALVVEMQHEGTPYKRPNEQEVFIKYVRNYHPRIRKIRSGKTYRYETDFAEFVRLDRPGTYQMRAQLLVEPTEGQISNVPPVFSNWISITVKDAPNSSN